MRPNPDTRSRDRLLFLLKTKGPQTASELAERLDVTPAAVRQHLAQLEEEGLVAPGDLRSGPGRPSRAWTLAPGGEARFPEGYAELAVGLIAGVREAFGDEGLERLIEHRTKDQLAAYRRAMPPASAPLSKRVAALARLRTKEGYMAEWKRDGDAYLLIENHCPVCAIAQVCQGICGGEQDLFRRLLGRGVRVERTEHVLDGARRCVYRVE